MKNESIIKRLCQGNLVESVFILLVNLYFIQLSAAMVGVIILVKSQTTSVFKTWKETIFDKVAVWIL